MGSTGGVDWGIYYWFDLGGDADADFGGSEWYDDAGKEYCVTDITLMYGPECDSGCESGC